MNQLELFESEAMVFYGTEQYDAFVEYCESLEDRCVYCMKRPDRRGYYQEIEAVNESGKVAIWKKK